ncbi:hypothetical protein RND81_08G083300 [Saponaria officinalis]|uniref:Retrovirus-related Pol polyprotein from transposon TNT 1-94-like beta-barrel domain-containing protein n=1 Tax=Saponaria officinalis TaxID=3572 RepID=A0AAW1J5S3_SAPOF
MVAFPSGEHNDTVWYLDSRASSHMTNNEGILSNKSIYSGSIRVKVANGSELPIGHIGNFTLNSGSQPIHLKYVLHVPNNKFNLLSVQKVCGDNNCVVTFDKSCVCFKDRNTNKR